MIIGTPETRVGQYSEGCHDGIGPYFERVLLKNLPGCAITYVVDMVLPPGSSIGVHPHIGTEELYFIEAGMAVMVVDDEERLVGPGSAILNPHGHSHGLRNESRDDVHLFVVRAKAPG